MGQFKPMVKMETTEPSVILKLKKGGHVNMKKGGMAEGGHKKMAMGGGAMDMMSGTPALVGRPAVNAPVRSPMKPSMASRRKAMMAKKPAMAMPPMKEGGESKKTHMAEMSKMKGLEKELKSHESKPASKGHKGLKTGGVALGNAGGFKKGGMATGGVKMGNAGGFKDGGMSMVEKDGKMVPDFAADGKGKMKKGGMMGGGGMHMMPDGKMMKNSAMKMGGMATGGVKMGNAGGFKHGGKSSKKAYATGGTVDSGKPVAMLQGAKKPSSPVSTNRQAGTFKKGGKVTPAEGNLMKAFGKENASAMKSAKAQSNDVYSKYQKMQGGGAASDKDKYFVGDPKAVSDKASRELEEAMNPLSMVKELYGKARDAVRGEGSMSAAESNAMQRMTEDAKQSGTGAINTQKLRDAMMKSGRSQRDIDSLMRGQGAITETERSVTVSPAGKRRGGRAC